MTRLIKTIYHFGMYLTLLWIACYSQGHAQQQPAISGRQVIDGSTTPELIPDSTAFRLVLSALAEPRNATNEQAARQRRKLVRFVKTDADRTAFSTVLADFQENYANLRGQYQKNPGLKSTQPYVSTREVLISNTIAQLSQQLSPDAMARLRAFVQNSKARMTVSRSN